MSQKIVNTIFYEPLGGTYNFGALGDIYEGLDFEVKRSKVKVTTRLDMVQKGRGMHVDRSLSSSV